MSVNVVLLFFVVLVVVAAAGAFVAQAALFTELCATLSAGTNVRKYFSHLL